MLDKNGKQLQRSSITKVDAFSKYYKTLLKLPRNVVATSSAQVREAGAELGAAARPGDGLPRGAGGPAPGVLPLLRPVARSELACVLCLLSLVSCALVSGHVLRVSAIFGPQYFSCGYTVPSLLRTKINGKSYLIFI